MASKVTYVDVTPTWEQIVPVLLQILEGGNKESHIFVHDELTRMARLADKQVALVKAGVV